MPGSCPIVGTWGSKTLAWGFVIEPHRLRVLVEVVLLITVWCLTIFEIKQLFCFI